MYALKEKVSDQLSRFFADSPNSSSSSPSSPSTAPDNHQARLSSKERKSSSSSSSYFSLGIPSLSFAGYRYKKNQHGFKPIQSLPVRLSKGIEQEDECSSTPYHECNVTGESENFQKYCDDDKKNDAVCKELTVETQAGNDYSTPRGNDYSTPRSNGTESDIFGEARDQRSPLQPLPDLMDESSFISFELYEFLKSSIPNIVKGCQWVLMYSTLKHGISLRTLIRKSAELPGPCLLITGDRQGAVFGGMLDCPLKPTAKRKYQGTNQSFVFTTVYGEPRLFRPTGANRYYYMCLSDILALGGGGNFALRLDGDLLNGTSGPSETFGNSCLAHTSEFELKNVEHNAFVFLV
ncbi:hypothetical protein Tsubulata_009496 [Turnera subulata]|uniref:TLDc domain-containing protein n=1 Tax=Turnera subulata TaxID=218843 RepID=A0A9Q0FAT4_9ROSI|nr:hypothetical protein Tsubulata_009496 [Turnera subulata]